MGTKCYPSGASLAQRALDKIESECHVRVLILSQPNYIDQKKEDSPVGCVMSVSTSSACQCQWIADPRTIDRHVKDSRSVPEAIHIGTVNPAFAFSSETGSLKQMHEAH